MGEGTVHKTSCLCGAMRLELKGDPIFKVWGRGPTPPCSHYH